MVAFGAILALVSVASSSSFAHPLHGRDHGQDDHHTRDLRIVGTSMSTMWKRQAEPGSEFRALVDGNKAFRDEAGTKELLATLTNQFQEPPFMFLGCSDSRVSEGTIFKTKPGTFFTQRNIANQFEPTDPNTQSVLAFAVGVLGVQHVIVMGHYGCGGVGAAIASAPTANVDAGTGVVQAWINPIRELFRTSSRPEIVELRERIKANATVGVPNDVEPGYRALVEENVRTGVGRIAQDSIIVNHYAALASAGSAAPSIEGGAEQSGGLPKDVFIHGWVYDVANGEVRDLGISVGPPGKAIPPPPFASVAQAVGQVATGHSKAPAPVVPDPVVEGRCLEQCKMKRNVLAIRR